MERTIKAFHLIGKRQQIPREGGQAGIDGLRPHGKFPMFAGLHSVRFQFGIRCEKIGPGNLQGLASFDLWEASQINGQVHCAGGLSIKHEKSYFSLSGVMNRRRDKVVDRSRSFGFALRRLNLCLKDATMSMLGDQFEGMKDGLAPSRSARLSKNGCDNIDQLGQAGRFHTIRVV